MNEDFCNGWVDGGKVIMNRLEHWCHLIVSTACLS
jgi:hypothetical protein